MDKIYTAQDRANELGFTSYIAYIESILKITIPSEISNIAPVNAVVDGGRWLAHCGGNCGGSGYVDPDKDGFYCTVCKNIESGGVLRHVVFPDNYIEIENELLNRTQDMPKGMFGTQGAMMASGLPRAWNVGESIDDLIAQREAYSAVTKDELMREYLVLQSRLNELETTMQAKDKPDGI